MAQSGAGKSKGKRPAPLAEPKRSRRFVHPGSLVTGQVRKVVEKRGFAQTRLLTEWDEVVGPEIAALARPDRVGYARDGIGATLHLACRPGAAPQVQMMEGVIRERVNACYGYNAVTKIRLATVATGLAAPGAAFATQARPRPVEPEGSSAAEVHARPLADVKSDTLRAALAQLGSKIRHIP